MLGTVRFLGLAMALGCFAAFGAGFSHTGTFLNDNDLKYFNVTLGADGVLTVRTFGYAGGLNQLGNTIADGGFAPALWVFDGAGTLLAQDSVGGTVPICNGRGIDPTTGSCYDALVPVFLPAGAYTVVLSQQGNNPLGVLSDGFFYSPPNGNDPDFTGDNSGQIGTKFVDPFGIAVRNGNWAVDFTGDTLRSASAADIPEPGSACLLLMGVAALAGRRYSRSRR
ncbi:MAG: DVUA0089 family protein [Bryobacterales bacterium]|nr:DVUA0089 family protein [Bryobacterales bacterium]